MSEPTVFHAVFKRIAESKTGIEQFLAGGGANNHEAYVRLVGKYEALGQVEAELKDIEQRYIAD
jgi:hypothetical protein